MPMNWGAKAFVVLAIVVGIYYGAYSGDRDRWLAALRVSRTSAVKLRMENEQRRVREARAAEEARWRQPVEATAEPHFQPGAGMSREDICAGLREREALLKAKDGKPDASAEKLKLLCADLDHLDK
jgi:hypothetical protein